MNRRRLLPGLLCALLAVFALRVGLGAHRVYTGERERMQAAMAEVASSWALVNAAPRNASPSFDTSPNGSQSLLAASSRSAAAAELAQIISVADSDSAPFLTILPVSDSTTLGQLRRAALGVRFEGDTEQLVHFIAGILGASTLIRVDHLSVIAKSADDGIDPASLSVDARLSAWFAESHR